jgi:hypothetical protein
MLPRFYNKTGLNSLYLLQLLCSKLGTKLVVNFRLHSGGHQPSATRFRGLKELYTTAETPVAIFPSRFSTKRVLKLTNHSAKRRIGMS